MLLFVSQYHFWSQLSSESRFAPEFPRPIVVLFNWAFGATALLACVQVLLDLGMLTAALVRQGAVGVDPPL